MASSSALQLADVALVWSNALGSADLAMIDSDLASDRGLVTALLLSWFTDRRAEDDDKPPSGDARDRRGWWADEFAVTGDRFGSRLWLLDRSKLTNETKLRAEEYLREGAAWMIEDRVVESIDILIEQLDKRGFLISGGLKRPGRDPVSFRFAHTWEHLQEDI